MSNESKKQILDEMEEMIKRFNDDTELNASIDALVKEFGLDQPTTDLED